MKILNAILDTTIREYVHSRPIQSFIVFVTAGGIIGALVGWAVAIIFGLK